jgi:hypothetical protein
MDCAKLEADIERLREARNAFDEAVAATNDMGLGKIKGNKAMKRASELEDEILRTYMEDVGKHNPELFRSFRYGEEIDGFRETVHLTLKLSDNEVLVCGSGFEGEARILRKGEDGSWNYDSNSIDGFRNAACSTVKLSDNEVLVCGNDGETRILHTDIDINLDKLKQKLPDIAAKKDEARTT